MHGQPRHSTRPYVQSPPNILGMDARMTSQLNEAWIRNVRGSLIRQAHFIDMLSMSVLQPGTGRRPVD